MNQIKIDHSAFLISLAALNESETSISRNNWVMSVIFMAVLV